MPAPRQLCFDFLEPSNDEKLQLIRALLDQARQEARTMWDTMDSAIFMAGLNRYSRLPERHSREGRSLPLSPTNTGKPTS